MKFLWAICLLGLFSCNKQKNFSPGTYFLYDLLDDTSFFAMETLKENGEGTFKELNLYEGDTCQVAEISFNWKAFKDHIIYQNQQHAVVKGCNEIQPAGSIPDQVYDILERGEDYFVAKTYFINDLSPTDSSIVLWKRKKK